MRQVKDRIVDVLDMMFEAVVDLVCLMFEGWP